MNDFQETVNPQPVNSKLSDILDEATKLSISIFDDSGNNIGYMVPVTKTSLIDEDLLKLMTKWRNESREYFLTRFEATPERTKAWLDTTVLTDKNRMLFLIYSPSKLIGHYGFKNLNADSAEIDSLVRGESGGHPQLIHFAEKALVSWLFSEFDIDSLYGYVLAENWRAIDLHAQIGFKNAEVYPLIKEEIDNEVFLNMGNLGDKSSDGLYVQKIVLERINYK